MKRISDASPRVLRAPFARRMVSVGAATATNIDAHEKPFLAGVAAALLGAASYLVVTTPLYRPYTRSDRVLGRSQVLTTCRVLRTWPCVA